MAGAWSALVQGRVGQESSNLKIKIRRPRRPEFKNGRKFSSSNGRALSPVAGWTRRRDSISSGWSYSRRHSDRGTGKSQ
jgi:hypothetical protein